MFPLDRCYTDFGFVRCATGLVWRLVVLALLRVTVEVPILRGILQVSDPSCLMLAISWTIHARKITSFFASFIFYFSKYILLLYGLVGLLLLLFFSLYFAEWVNTCLATGWNSEIGLCENEFQSKQSINRSFSRGRKKCSDLY